MTAKLTQANYELWTGSDASKYSTEQWTKLETVAEQRLASFLCLRELPTDEQGNLPADLEQLLANFMAGVFAHEGVSQSVESKHVRNFTINFKTEIAANAFAQIAGQYGDIIEGYSNCNLTFAVESSARYSCNKGCACGGD